VINLKTAKGMGLNGVPRALKAL